ncbi:unnamed protein product, partial [Allacma fusca]
GDKYSKNKRSSVHFHLPSSAKGLGFLTKSLMASSIRGQSVYTNIENKLRGVFNNVRGSSVCWPIRYGWK